LKGAPGTLSNGFTVSDGVLGQPVGANPTKAFVRKIFSIVPNIYNFTKISRPVKNLLKSPSVSIDLLRRFGLEFRFAASEGPVGRLWALSGLEDNSARLTFPGLYGARIPKRDARND
jgi:hypothetical protein